MDKIFVMVIEWEVAKNLLHLWLSLGVRGVEKKCLGWVIGQRFQVEIKEDTKNKEVSIFCDAGRVLRPLLVVQNLHKFRLLKGGSHLIQDLLDSGIVELIGPKEEEDCRTAWEASILNQAQKEQNHRPSRGGNFPLGAGNDEKYSGEHDVTGNSVSSVYCY
ncbi:DNA-directed RNA polymerases IV and V subunit 2-like protein [Tanacetum coccineum]